MAARSAVISFPEPCYGAMPLVGVSLEIFKGLDRTPYKLVEDFAIRHCFTSVEPVPEGIAIASRRARPGRPAMHSATAFTCDSGRCAFSAQSGSRTAPPGP